MLGTGWTLAIVRRLWRAGWRPWRRLNDQLPLPDWIEIHPEARRILDRFGQLTFGDQYEKVTFEPTLADEVAEEIQAYESLLENGLYPLGRIDQDLLRYILVDALGFIYFLNHDLLEPVATSFERALPILIEPWRDHRSISRNLEQIGWRYIVWRIGHEGDAYQAPRPALTPLDLDEALRDHLIAHYHSQRIDGMKPEAANQLMRDQEHSELMRTLVLAAAYELSESATRRIMLEEDFDRRGRSTY